METGQLITCPAQPPGHERAKGAAKSHRVHGASIAAMELAGDAVILAVPSAMDAGVNTVLYRAILALALAIAFFATMPLNRWLISRGKGHALLHAHHMPNRRPARPGVHLVSQNGHHPGEG